MTVSDILGISLIEENQAGKYLTHNQAMFELEGRLVRCLSRTEASVPASPSDGDVYIQNIDSGDWADGSVNDIAHYYDSAWHFYSPVTGQMMYVTNELGIAIYNGTVWHVFIHLQELGGDPLDPPDGAFALWQSDGTDSGDDGDFMIKITDSGGTTKTTTIIDYSAA